MVIIDKIKDQVNLLTSELADLDEVKPYISFNSIENYEERLFIKGNPEGLLLLGNALLRIAINDPSIEVSTTGNYIIDKVEVGFDDNSEYSLEYVHKLNLPSSEIRVKTKLSWKDHLLIFGVKLIFISIAVITIIGFVTVVQWLF